MNRVIRALMLILMCGMVTAGLKLHLRIDDLESHPYEQCVILSLPKLIEQARLSTVHINVDDKMWQGSGVIIDEHTVLTAGHVVDSAIDIEVTLNNGYHLHAKYWHKDPNNNDCGVIKFKEKFLPSRISKFADSNSVTVGGPVIIAGSPYGDKLFNTVAFGIVSGLDRDINSYWSGMITLDCLADPGYSGGPVFNMKGEIVGIVVGTYSYYGNGTVVTPIDICKEMLKNEKAYKPSGDNKPVGEDILVDESEGQGK